MHRALSALTGFTATIPGQEPGSPALAAVAAPLRGSDGPIGLVYVQRPLSLGSFTPPDAHTCTIVGCCLGTRLGLLSLSERLVEWTQSYDQLVHACQVVLPNLAAQLDGDLGRLEAIASHRNAQSTEDLAHLVLAECAQIRIGLETYLRWLRGETVFSSSAPT